MKRRSSTSFQQIQPIFKKPTLLPPSSSTTTSPHQLRVFTRLPPPVNFPGTKTNVMVPNNRKIVAREPPTTILNQSAFELTLLANNVTTYTPPPVPVARRLLRSPSSGEMCLDSVGEEITNAKMPKRKKVHWWDQVVHEEEEEEKYLGSEDGNRHTPKNERGIETEEKEEEEEEAVQEAVWVEKYRECLILHFRCPCGEDYEILLLGNNCFYKLM